MLGSLAMLSLCVCENRDGLLVAWGSCECALIRFSTVWNLPCTLFKRSLTVTSLAIPCPGSPRDHC